MGLGGFVDHGSRCNEASQYPVKSASNPAGLAAVHLAGWVAVVSRVTIIFLLLFGFRFRNIPIRLLSHLYALMFIACVFLAIMILFLHNFVSVFISIVTHFGYFEVSSRLFLSVFSFFQ